MKAILEIACFSAEDAPVAAQAGASRIELCRDCGVGGLTPSLHDLVFVKERVHVPVFVMIRDRAGDFIYSGKELDRMKGLARELLANGADGLVFGALTEDGKIDESAVRAVVELAGSCPVTFHRAFDEARNPSKALDVLKRCGVTRVLTSGGHPTAMEGVDTLTQLVEWAGDDFNVIPGGGVRSHNVKELLDKTGALEVHSAARTTEPRVDPEEVRQLVEVLA